ncbi:response regulator transcription factor [Tautonia plasticadhaerens]|uniref:Oxygen regulatory protein NreC n=1 Tax=Tautonia plasticadhaerens TaxID=2527974 RepID=A0A518H308_9BACT|nr:response regulator transcription factor [Tautonia plasticadhaerens]QDV35222.1 Oxygen regulatory protein NreC [Tautonia plasticadhaerens]
MPSDTSPAGSPDPPARVLIVDDHPAVREGLGFRIARCPDLVVCGEAADVAEALDQAERARPDVSVIDIALGTGSGIDLIRRLRARDPSSRTLVWSMYPESLYAERALRAGAMGYITKQEATGRIIEAIRRVHRGEIFLSDAAAGRLIRRVVGRGVEVPASPTLEESLSDRELEVLRQIGAGHTTAETARCLHLSVHTVDTYRQRIKAKLALRNASELARVATQWVLEHG